MACRIFHKWGLWIKTNEQNTVTIDSTGQVIQLHDYYSRTCGDCGETQNKSEWNHRRITR